MKDRSLPVDLSYTGRARVSGPIIIAPRIPATTLAHLNAPNLCERCFTMEWWLGQQPSIEGAKFPFRIPLPGVFSTIDAHAKSIVRGYLDRSGRLPNWFPTLPVAVNGYLTPGKLHWSRFRYLSRSTGIEVRACPDEVFTTTQKAHFILDYKTATLTQMAKELRPRYEAQLAIEAVIGKKLRILDSVEAALLYLEPIRGELVQESPALDFRPVLQVVTIDLTLPSRLLKRAQQIIEHARLNGLPPVRLGCPQCELLDRVLSSLIRMV